MQKRQLWLTGLQAGDGLFRELSYFLQTQKPMFAVELMRQFHYLDDLQKHFSECGIPQFEKFVEALRLNDGSSFLEKVGKLNVGDLCTGFIVPGVQIITTCLAIVRLGQMLTSNQRLTPEQQFMLDLVERAFQGHQQMMNAQFDALKGHLDRNQAELKGELKQLHSDISFIGQELHKAIENSKKEIQDQLHSHDFNAFKFEVDQLVRTWLERDRTFWNHFEFIPEAKRVHKALCYLGELEAALSTCGENSLNGLTLTNKRWQSRFTPEYMATGPEYVSGALAQQIGLNGSVPNLSLFKTLSSCIENLRQSCHYPEVQKQLDRLQPILEKHQTAFITLSSLRQDTLKSAMLARRDYLRSIFDAKTKTRQFSRAVQKQLAQGQITHLLADNGSNWLDTERVGEHKFFLSKLVHQGSISSHYTPNISSLDNGIEMQFVHHIAKTGATAGTLIGAALGLVGGPAGSAIGAGIGGIGGYAYLWPIAGAQMAMEGAANWLNDTTSPSRQRELLLEREIKEILNRSIVENIKLRQSPNRDSDFTIQAEYCNSTQQHLVTALKMEKKLGTLFFSATNEYPQPKNSKPIVAFRITTGSQLIDDDAQVFNFERNSLIQSEDIARIAPAPNSVDYAVRSRRMLRSYFDFLLSKVSKAGMEESNPFKAIAQEAQLIPSATGEFLPIAMPPKLLKSIQERVYATDFGLMAMKDGGLVPSFHFQKAPSKDDYEFTVIYKRFKSSAGTPEEYGEIPLLTFDRAVVESFRKVSFPQQGNEHDYVFGKPNLQEFLIQAWYCGLFELGLPGKGTIRLTNADVFVPSKVSFAGVYTLLKQNPNRKIHYTSEFAGENHNELLGDQLQFKQGRGAFRVWLDAKQGKPKPKSIETAAQDYAEKYHLAIAHFNLFSQIDPSDVNAWFEQHLGLFSPNKPELALAQAFLRDMEGESSS
jgi:hypothetical protein